MDNSTSKVQIIACGQRQIKSRKSGLTFPSFLIAFKDKSDRHQIFRWRSKKDFLLLNRAIACNSSSKGEEEGTSRNNAKCFFPKSAYTNLCKEAISEPWVRPLKGMPEFSTRSNDIFRMISATADSPQLGGDKKLEGVGFKAKMKKSLLQLDQFLQYVQNEARDDVRNANRKILENAWDYFCRDEDSEDVVGHTNNQIDMQSTINADFTQENNERLAAKCGQYFASDCNAQKVRKNTEHDIHPFCAMHATDCII